MMQLSIVIPTHRRDLSACSRILQACDWAGDKVEVVIRDNSGDIEKRRFLGQINREHCNITSVEECAATENFDQALKLAHGDFVFFVADDDICFDRAIAALPLLIDEIKEDNAVAAITGAYVLENSKGSGIFEYQGIDSDDLATRVTGYLNYSGPNLLAYSPIRRTLLQRLFGFMSSMPCSFSFHDQILSLLYLLNGKFARLKRILYLYDYGPWETLEGSQEHDLAFYAGSKLDPAINALHWFLCGFEGALLIRNSDLFSDQPRAVRQAVADQWFSWMFMRFKNVPRLTFDSRFAREVHLLCELLKARTGQMSFNEMLTAIVGFMALFDKPRAAQYAAFWTPIITRG
jgi:hypothetical protein